MEHNFDMVAARARNRAVTAFVFVSQNREEIAPEVLAQDGFLMSAAEECSDPSRIVFPLQFDDAIKNAEGLITKDRVDDALHRMTERQKKLAALRSVGSEIVDDLVAPFTFSEDVMRDLNGVPQKFAVRFVLGDRSVADQIDEQIPFIRLDRDLREISTSADSVGGYLQGVKVVHTSMSEMADDVSRAFGIGFRLSPLQQFERKVHRAVQDLTGWKPPNLVN